MTLAILISPASSTTCYSTSPQCCWVKRSWELMGKTTSVDPTSPTACCNYVVSSTGTTIIQNSGIPGVWCTSTGTVTKIYWSGQSLQGRIPSKLESLVNLQYLYLSRNPGLKGTLTPQCRTTSGAIPVVSVSDTNVTICGCAAASNPPGSFPPAGTPDACLASGPALTLSNRILVFSQLIGSLNYTCHTDANKNPYADCLNSMAKICNPSDPTFVKANCHTGVNMMFGNMSIHWQYVRYYCGRWPFTINGQTYVGNSASSYCRDVNTSLRRYAFYIENGIRVNVTSGITESTISRLWEKVTA